MAAEVMEGDWGGPKSFPLVRVQISPQRFAYANRPCAATRVFEEAGRVSVNLCGLVTHPMTYTWCDKLEKHYAKYGALPGWVKEFLLRPEFFKLDGHTDKYAGV